MKVMSLIAGIIMLIACFFEIAVFANDLVAGNISLIDLEISSFYSPMYLLVDATLAAWFFVNFASTGNTPH